MLSSQEIREGSQQKASNLYKKALEAYKSASALEPHHVLTHIKGFVLRKLGETNDKGLENGIKSFDVALTIEPNDYRAWYNKACYYAALSDPPEESI